MNHHSQTSSGEGSKSIPVDNKGYLTPSDLDGKSMPVDNHGYLDLEGCEDETPNVYETVK